MAKMSQICGSTYYSRLLPQHLSDIECYPKEVVDHLKMGGFSMNIKGFNWHSQALDEGHETCINRDLKHVLTTATGSSFLKFINYMPTRAATLANIKKQLNISEYKLSEPSKKLLVDIELNIGALLEKWNNSALALDLVKTENLLHLFKLDKAGTTSQIENIVNLHNTADSHFKQYIKSSLSTSKYLFPKQKMLRLTGFGANKTPTTSNVKKSLKDKQQELKMTKIIMEWSNEQNVAVTNLDQFISLPRAIALENGDMVTSNSKSKCKDTYKKIYKESFKTGLDLSSMDSIVLDAMFIVHNTPVRFYKRFSEYLSSLFVKYVSTLLKDVKEVIIAFDYQTLSDKSPKQLLRNKRDGDDFSERLIHFNRESSLPSNWKTFIKNRENKQQLVNLICEEFVLLGTKLLQPGKVIIIGGGFLDSHKTVHVELGTSYELGTHITNIDEGDSLVWFYALKSKYDNIVIYSPDNDVYHIGLPLISDIINKDVVILTDFNDKNYIKINTLKNEIAQDLDFMSDHTDVALIFQVFYICTGCDYVSFFIGNGKVSFFKTLKTHFKFINSENGGIFTGRLSFFNGSNYMIGFLAFVRLVCCQYLSKCKYAFTCISPTLVSPESIFLHFRQEDLSEFENHRIFVDKIRQSLFYRAGSEENYLPSYDALLLHWKRTCWVARVWQQCLSSCVLYPRIEDHGWEIKENRIKVIWDSDENFAKVDANIKLWTVGCECLKSMCGTKTCGCRKRNKHCGPACLKCRGCCLNQIKSFDNISDSELHDSIVAVDSNETSAELPLTEDDFIESESEEEFD